MPGAQPQMQSVVGTDSEMDVFFIQSAGDAICFFHCFWEQQLHIVGGRFDVDLSFSLILLYIQKCFLVRESRCQRRDLKFMMLLLSTSRRTVSLSVGRR